jgi:hypothetical protein
MPECRLNDPAVLAAWLDGSLAAADHEEIDRHLLEGCSVCWSVLRFVDRLRELVGRAAGTSDADAENLAILLDSDAIRRAMGLPSRGAVSRELLLDLGSWRVALRVHGEPGDAARVVELRTVPGSSAPAPGSVRLEAIRGESVLAMARTDAGGKLHLPLDGHEPVRLKLHGPGVDAVSLPMPL